MMVFSPIEILLCVLIYDLKEEQISFFSTHKDAKSCNDELNRLCHPLVLMVQTLLLADKIIKAQY